MPAARWDESGRCILNGDLLVGENRPGSWESPAAFVHGGWCIRTDAAAARTLCRLACLDRIWTALDAAYGALQAGTAFLDPLSDEQRLAQALYASVPLMQMGLLRALSKKFASRLDTSGARVWNCGAKGASWQNRETQGIHHEMSSSKRCRSQDQGLLHQCALPRADRSESHWRVSYSSPQTQFLSTP